MNIAFDGRPLLGRRTGVASWLTGLAAALARRGHRVLLLVPRKPEAGLKLHRNIDVIVCNPLSVPGTVWLHWWVPRVLEELGAPVFVGSLAICPSAGTTRYIPMVHDLTPLLMPWAHTVKNKFCFNAYIERSLAAAAAVVAGSERVGKQLTQLFPIVRHKLQVIGYGVSEELVASEEATKEESRLGFINGRRFLLFVGTLEPRKGFQTLVDAFSVFAHRYPWLDVVVAGGRGWGPRPRIPRELEDRIHLLGYVPRDDLIALYRACHLFVAASVDEGYGYPLAEALYLGCPCVVSNIEPFRELAAEAALYFEPGNARELASAVESVLLDSGLRSALSKRALGRRAVLSWEEPAAKWEDLLRRVCAQESPQ